MPAGATALLNSAEVGGMWKMYTNFSTEGVKRLGLAQLYVGDRAVTANLTVQQVNIGDGWAADAETTSYDGAFDSAYRLGEPLTVGADGLHAIYAPLLDVRGSYTYRLTDIYGNHFWTPAVDY